MEGCREPETWYQIRHDGFRELSHASRRGLSHHDAQLADLISERLARHVQQSCGAILVAFRLEQRPFDQIAAESRHRILIRTSHDAGRHDVAKPLRQMIHGNLADLAGHRVCSADDKMRFFVSGNREYSMDLLLGAHLLKEFRLELDFSRNRLIVTRLTSLDRRPADNQNLFFENFRPVVRATVQKHGWYIFVLDTGSEITYLNEVQLRSLAIDYFTPRIHSATLQGLGGARKHGAKIENVEIGVDKWAGTFKTLPMYTGNENDRAVGIIGENFLKEFKVIIDFGRMRVDLERR